MLRTGRNIILIDWEKNHSKEVLYWMIFIHMRLKIIQVAFPLDVTFIRCQEEVQWGILMCNSKFRLGANWSVAGVSATTLYKYSKEMEQIPLPVVQILFGEQDPKYLYRTGHWKVVAWSNPHPCTPNKAAILRNTFLVYLGNRSLSGDRFHIYSDWCSAQRRISGPVLR